MDALSKNPVLMIHGIDDTAAVFNRMTTYLKDRGWSTHSLSLIPNNGSVGLDQLAHQVANYSDRHFPNGRPFDLIGFSMGGLVSRYYLQRLGGINRVQRFITLAAPHNGSRIAHFRRNRGAAQMRPDSLFLQDLNRDVAMLKRINFTSVWTPYDLMISPANSSRLPVGEEVQTPVLLHPWMLEDERSLTATAAALAAPLKHKNNSLSSTRPILN
ncbi:MAG: lipase [Leptolyngbyaceae cyanobacterium MO_188.B28]|nr:lipase [Leptolyngbyaceae cyanobacterium MO_188.B28]